MRSGCKEERRPALNRLLEIAIDPPGAVGQLALAGLSQNTAPNPTASQEEEGSTGHCGQAVIAFTGASPKVLISSDAGQKFLKKRVEEYESFEGPMQFTQDLIDRSIFSRDLFVVRDPAHMIRIACKEPPVRTGRVEE